MDDYSENFTKFGDWMFEVLYGMHPSKASQRAIKRMGVKQVINQIDFFDKKYDLLIQEGMDDEQLRKHWSTHVRVNKMPRNTAASMGHTEYKLEYKDE